MSRADQASLVISTPGLSEGERISGHQSPARTLGDHPHLEAPREPPLPCPPAAGGEGEDGRIPGCVWSNVADPNARARCCRVIYGNSGTGAHSRVTAARETTAPLYLQHGESSSRSIPVRFEFFRGPGGGLRVPLHLCGKPGLTPVAALPRYVLAVAPEQGLNRGLPVELIAQIPAALDKCVRTPIT